MVWIFFIFFWKTFLFYEIFFEKLFFIFF